ncbi:PREDICTED: UPF0481 protein At3g47200-like [Nelumbo nucifera]|nr:PREDICTED: UPF0481 protein At3g47200-like [Nelumbo nucifera]
MAKSTSEMEPLKFWYLNQLLHRQKTLGRDGTLGQLINAIGVLMVDAQDCYQGPIGGSDELFIEIMIVDGCFIIELFRKFDGKLVQRDDTDPVFNLSFMITHLTGDLLLLENQLPWSVLEILFLLTMVPGEETTSLSGLALQFFGSMMLLSKKPVAQSSTLKNMHLLGFIRNTLISQFKFEEGADYSEWDPIPCATSLVDAGVKLRLGNADNILNVKFDNGILEIPPVLIQENAESLFRNLIALEQCDKIFTDQIITSYAILLDYLINTSKDVDFLHRKEILQNVLGAQDIASFFHKLFNDTFIWNFYYKGLSQQVNAYCRRRWPRWKVSLKRNYLNTPWAILSIVAAVVLLILTFLQTLYTIVN